jgi:hypothetical protein
MATKLSQCCPTVVVILEKTAKSLVAPDRGSKRRRQRISPRKQQNVPFPLVISLAEINAPGIGFSALLKDASPNRISLDRHSSLADRTQRSANAFRFGLRAGRRKTLRTSCYQRLPELLAELRIAVVQLIPRSAQIPGGLVSRVTAHLTHPLFGGVIRPRHVRTSTVKKWHRGPDELAHPVVNRIHPPWRSRAWHTLRKGQHCPKKRDALNRSAF